ncbi:hypothetical protein [Methyloglobulus sp.]
MNSTFIAMFNALAISSNKAFAETLLTWVVMYQPLQCRCAW